MSIDAPVHAALVTLFAYVVRFLAGAIGVDLGEDLYTQLAGVIVAYILSLFGLGLFRRARNKQGVLGAGDEYRAPFT